MILELIGLQCDVAMRCDTKVSRADDVACIEAPKPYISTIGIEHAKHVDCLVDRADTNILGIAILGLHLLQCLFQRLVANPLDMDSLVDDQDLCDVTSKSQTVASVLDGASRLYQQRSKQSGSIDCTERWPIGMPSAPISMQATQCTQHTMDEINDFRVLRVNVQRRDVVALLGPIDRVVVLHIQLLAQGGQ
jgi:hypothetical protein